MIDTRSWSSSLKLVISLFVCLLIGAMTIPLMDAKDWYEALEKLPGSPRYEHYQYVWVPFHILMGLSLWQLWKGPVGERRFAMFAWFWTMMLLVVSWRLTFFYLHCAHCGFVNIFLLLFTLFFTIKGFYRYSKAASFLLVPYFIWILGMTIMVGYILYANPQQMVNPWWNT